MPVSSYAAFPSCRECRLSHADDETVTTCAPACGMPRPPKKRKARSLLDYGASSLEHFEFETLCVSNHTAWRFVEKTRFVRSRSAGRRCVAASHFAIFKDKMRGKQGGWQTSARLCGPFTVVLALYKNGQAGRSFRSSCGGADAKLTQGIPLTTKRLSPTSACLHAASATGLFFPVEPRRKKDSRRYPQVLVFSGAGEGT